MNTNTINFDFKDTISENSIENVELEEKYTSNNKYKDSPDFRLNLEAIKNKFESPATPLKLEDNYKTNNPYDKSDTPGFTPNMISNKLGSKHYDSSSKKAQDTPAKYTSNEDGIDSSPCPFEFALGLDFIPNKILPEKMAKYDFSDPLGNNQVRKNSGGANNYEGIIIESNQYYYIGEVNSDNQKHGRGIYHWPDGMKIYEGEWYKDVKQGWGVFFKRNRTKYYEGQVYNNLFYGYGVMFDNYGNETAKKGYFKNGRLIYPDDLTDNEKRIIRNYLINSTHRDLLSESELVIKMLCWKNRVNQKYEDGVRKQLNKNMGHTTITLEIVEKFINEYLYKYHNMPYKRVKKPKKKVKRVREEKKVKSKKTIEGGDYMKKNKVLSVLEYNLDELLPDNDTLDLRATETMLSDL